MTLFSKKINQSIGFPVVHTWKRAWTVFPLPLVSSSWLDRQGTCRKTRFTQKTIRCNSGKISLWRCEVRRGAVLFEELVSWHRTCYQETTHSGMIKRAKERYETELFGPNEARWKSCDLSLEAKQPLTRSKTSPYNRDGCFFCEGEGGYCQPLHTVSALSTGTVKPVLSGHPRGML